MRILFSTTLFFVGSFLCAQDIAGRWTTIDDESGKPRSVVEITVNGDKATGRIIRLFRSPNEEQDPSCTKCTDDRKGRKVIGLEIIRAMEKDGDEWEDGTILDPENGKIYDCKLWVENGELKVRGYVAFFFRTQTWIRAKN
jgi:uncharacterized protein (DUF2147 family)